MSEIRFVLKEVKTDLDKTVNEVTRTGPIFWWSPIRYSPKEEEASPNRDHLSDFKHVSARYSEAIAEYLRIHDIEKIREQKVLHNFTIGRKLQYKENWDKQINTAIESIVSKSPEKSNRKKSAHGGKSQSINKNPAKDIFTSFDFTGRTEGFYKNFAFEMLKRDMNKDRKNQTRQK